MLVGPNGKPFAAKNGQIIYYMLKLKQTSVAYVHLLRKGEVLSTVPVTSPQDLEVTKAMLLRYAATLDDPSSCVVQVLTLEKVVQSLI